MTYSEFKAMAMAMYGHDWQSPLARALNVSSRTVRRWAAESSPLPSWLGEKMTELAGGRAPSAMPRDEWMLAEGMDQRSYVVHAMPPRFIARVARVDDDGRLMPDEAATDLLSGVTYANDDVVLCEFQWIDRAPVGHALTLLLEGACDFFDSWDES